MSPCLLYTSTADKAWEVNVDSEYKIYKNLSLFLELGYIRMDLDSNVWKDYESKKVSSESEGSPTPVSPPASFDDSDDSQGIAAEVWTYIRAVERSGLKGSDESKYSSDEENSPVEDGEGDDDDDGGDGSDDGDGDSRGDNGGSRSGNDGRRGGDGGSSRGSSTCC